VKGKRKSFESDPCPVARALDAIGDWWSLLIIRDALAGNRRFGEFQKSLGLAKNILTARLRKLAAHGIMKAVPASDGSAYHDYILTDKGKRLHLVITAIWQWSETSLFAPGEMQRVLCDRLNGEPLARIEVRASDGRVLQARDMLLKRDVPSP
jgi:DNA-binding HxlR family transcriptional regulator